MAVKKNRKFFLISFLPAMAYWYLEANYSIRTAIIGGLSLAIIEILFEKLLTKKIHTITVFNFSLICFLGLLSILGNEGIWFKLQPTFTGIGIGCFLLIKRAIGGSLFFEMMKEMNGENSPPEFIILIMEKHIAFLFFLYGIFMIFVAFKMTTDQWLFFKTIGFYIAFFIFMILEIIYIRVLIYKKGRESKIRRF